MILEFMLQTYACVCHVAHYGHNPQITGSGALLGVGVRYESSIGLAHDRVMRGIQTVRFAAGLEPNYASFWLRDCRD